MLSHDFCDEVIVLLQLENESNCDFVKLYKLLLLFEMAWDYQFSKYELENKMLKNLPNEKSNSEDNIDFLVVRISDDFEDSKDIKLFVKAAKIMFLTYAKKRKLIQLKDKIIGKNNRFMEQFENIKKRIKFE